MVRSGRAGLVHWRRWLLAALAAAAIAAGGMTALIDTSRPARANSACAASCNSQHDQCMASSNDRYGCDAKRNQCLKSCGGG